MHIKLRDIVCTSTTLLYPRGVGGQTSMHNCATQGGVTQANVVTPTSLRHSSSGRPESRRDCLKACADEPGSTHPFLLTSSVKSRGPVTSGYAGHGSGPLATALQPVGCELVRRNGSLPNLFKSDPAHRTRPEDHKSLDEVPLGIEPSRQPCAARAHEPHFGLQTVVRRDLAVTSVHAIAADAEGSVCDASKFTKKSSRPRPDH